MIVEILAFIVAGTIIFIVLSKKENINKIDRINADKNKSGYQKSKERLEARKETRIRQNQRNDEEKYNRENIINVEIISKQKKPFRSFTKEQRREWKKKGDEYEAFVANKFYSEGYNVIERGKLEGRKDGGIDLIATKGNELILIQCKNWNAENKKRITKKEVSEFVGDVHLFIEKNLELKNMKIKRLYVTSEKILDKAAEHIFRANSEQIEYLHLPISID